MLTPAALAAETMGSSSRSGSSGDGDISRVADPDQERISGNSSTTRDPDGDSPLDTAQGGLRGSSQKNVSDDASDPSFTTADGTEAVGLIVVSEDAAAKIDSIAIDVSAEDKPKDSPEMAAATSSPVGSDAAAKEELEASGISVKDEISTPSGASLIAARPTGGQSLDEAIEQAQSLPSVAYVQPDYSYSLIDDLESDSAYQETDASQQTASAARQSASSPQADASESMGLLSDAIVNDPYALNTLSSFMPNQYWLEEANLFNAWDKATTDHRVTIAILDTGVHVPHIDLNDNIMTDLAWDAYNDMPLNTGADPYLDKDGHGTHVSGIAAAVAGNGAGIAGASYNANILPIRVVNPKTSKTSTSRLSAAYRHLFELIDSGQLTDLRVINMSLGEYTNLTGVDSALEELINEAKDRYGILTVCAGGNGDANGPLSDRLYPSDFDACLSVTALEPGGNSWYRSDQNSEKDLSAPGAAIWSTGIDQTHPTATNVYTKMTGSSMASALVSGAAALLFAAYPQATVDQVKEALYSTADPVADLELSGSGSHGAINVADALDALDDIVTSSHFDDVQGDEWYGTAVAQAVNLNYLIGYANSNSFGPQDNLARGQAAVVFLRMSGAEGLMTDRVGELATNDNVDNPFRDVRKGDYFNLATFWANLLGVVHGYTGGYLFGPHDNITREQFATMIANYAKARGLYVAPSSVGEILSRFPDGDEVSAWARETVAWAANHGYIGAGGELNPSQVLTRAEAAAMSVRYQPAKLASPLLPAEYEHTQQEGKASE